MRTSSDPPEVPSRSTGDLFQALPQFFHSFPPAEGNNFHAHVAPPPTAWMALLKIGNPSPDRQGGIDPTDCLNRSLTVAARCNLIHAPAKPTWGTPVKPPSDPM